MFFNNKFNTFFGLNLTFPMCMAWRFHFPIRNYDFKKFFSCFPHTDICFLSDVLDEPVVHLHEIYHSSDSVDGPPELPPRATGRSLGVSNSSAIYPFHASVSAIPPSSPHHRHEPPFNIGRSSLHLGSSW